LLVQFSVEPSKVVLNSVCHVRADIDAPIVLKVGGISLEQLDVIRNHNKLFNRSSVFRQIHEKVTEDENGVNEGASDSSKYLHTDKKFRHFVKYVIND